MVKVDFVFVILLYRNMSDIIEYLKNLKKIDINKRIVLVNSYYDEKTKEESRKIAEKYDCDIIQVENKGYGAGNNAGICYVEKHYDYKFVIVSNPDILIEKFETKKIAEMTNCVIGPVIHTLTGKNQNPYWIRKNLFFENILYKGMKNNCALCRYFAFGYFRFEREKALKKGKNLFEAYALHGSFVMFHQQVIRKLKEVYDPSFFMYSEEVDVASRLQKMGIKSYVTRDVEVMHKEDGSVKLSNMNLNQMMRESYIKYYEKRLMR